MKPDEAKKLLGGYATGTLTPEEQQALFAAALDDQGLFDALAKEQALKETLDDPGARAELLAAVDKPNKARWLAWWPAPVGAAALALAGLAVFVALKPSNIEPTQVAVRFERLPEPPQVAVTSTPPAQATSKPAAAPVTPIEKRKIEAAPAKVMADLPQPVPEAPSVGGVVKLAAPAAVLQQTAEMRNAVESDEAKALFTSGYRAAAEAEVRAPRAAPQRTIAKKLEAADATAGTGPPAATGALGLRYAWSGRTLTLESNAAGHLYVLRTDGGTWTTIPPGGMEVRPNVAVRVPVPSGGEFAVVLSRSAVADPAGAAQSPAPRVVTSVAGTDHYVVAPGADLLVARIGAGPQ